MIHIRDLAFSYADGGFELRIDELRIDPGSIVAIIGPSGSGKTTLLHLVAGIIMPESGTIEIGSTNVTALSNAARRAFRLSSVGLVFQEFELLGYLSVLDNILLPYRIGSALTLDTGVRERAAALAEHVGIGTRLRRNVRRLSQGERQRVSVCRALITQPQLLLADEPTGNLDPSNRERVLDILIDYARETGSTLLTVTHDHALIDRFDRVIDFAAIHRFAAGADDADGIGVLQP